VREFEVKDCESAMDRARLQRALAWLLPNKYIYQYAQVLQQQCSLLCQSSGVHVAVMDHVQNALFSTLVRPRAIDGDVRQTYSGLGPPKEHPKPFLSAA